MGDCGPSGNRGDAETDGEPCTRGVDDVDPGVEVGCEFSSGGLLRVRRHIFQGLVGRGIGRQASGWANSAGIRCQDRLQQRSRWI